MAVGRRVDYAIRALSFIAGQQPQRVVPRAEIVAQQAVPRHLLSKVLRRLVAAGLLSATSGPRGGFRLARPAHTITLCEVYESIEGKLCLMGCVEAGEEFCCFAPVCTQIVVWRMAQEQLRNYLGTISLAAIADQSGLITRLASLDGPPSAGH
jgi:Rrf2 family protein